MRTRGGELRTEIQFRAVPCRRAEMHAGAVDSSYTRRTETLAAFKQPQSRTEAQTHTRTLRVSKPTHDRLASPLTTDYEYYCIVVDLVSTFEGARVRH